MTTCHHCGADYQPTSPEQLYCSKQCKHAAKESRYKARKAACAILCMEDYGVTCLEAECLAKEES